jgi:FeS assembly protein IscX
MLDENGATLYWDSAYAIALALIDRFPELSPEEVGLNQLADLVESLSDFIDDPALVNERLLLDIQIAWFEEMTNL